MNKPIIFIGDIHGNFNFLIKEINSKQITDCVLIQVGDFGIGFSDKETDVKILLTLNEFLKSGNNIMYVIRGNHDNPKFFDGTYQYSNLILLSDYTFLNIEGKNILFVGGAVSIDRSPRKRDMLMQSNNSIIKESYWYDETFVLNEEKIKNLIDINIVVTHTAPIYCAPLVANGFGYLVEDYARRDSNLLEDLKFEREQITKMFDILNIRNEITHHFYGHFHRRTTTKNNQTIHRLLDVNEFYELQ